MPSGLMRAGKDKDVILLDIFVQMAEVPRSQFTDFAGWPCIFLSACLMHKASQQILLLSSLWLPANMFAEGNQSAVFLDI